MKWPITEDYFEKVLGRLPIEDDMERVNCPHAGERGHEHCGWNKTHNKPAYQVTTPPSEQLVNKRLALKWLRINLEE